jgi:hypothetical protein
VNDRAGFLASLDVLASRVAAIAPGARVGFGASAIDSDWVVYFNGPPLILGHTPADLVAADALFDTLAPTGIRAVLRGGPYLFADGERVKPMARADGPVADA